MAELKYLDSRRALSLAEIREWWHFRDVLIMLVTRDLKVRYRQAVIGVLWALIQPIAMMAVFAWLFYRISENPLENPWRAFASGYLGLICWQIFAYSVREGTQSLVVNRNLVTKVYLPRLLLPSSVVVSACVDFLVAMPLILPLAIIAGIVPTLKIALAVPFLCLIVLATAACAIWMAALNALYRDIGHIVPFVLQMGLIVTPAAYEAELLGLDEQWYWIWGLNPLVLGIEGMRTALFDAPFPPVSLLVPGLVVTSLLTGFGLKYFRTVENWIADRV